MWCAVECAGVIWNGECSAKCGGSSVECCVTRCGGAMWCGVECDVIMQWKIPVVVWCGLWLCSDVEYTVLRHVVVMWNDAWCGIMWFKCGAVRCGVRSGMLHSKFDVECGVWLCSMVKELRWCYVEYGYVLCSDVEYTVLWHVVIWNEAWCGIMWFKCGVVRCGGAL